jgi:hypothetical protein
MKLELLRQWGRILALPPDRESVPVRSTAERKPSAESLRWAFCVSGRCEPGRVRGPLLGVRPRVGGTVEKRPGIDQTDSNSVFINFLTCPRML